MTTQLAAPLDERVEFVSRPWIESARTYLTAQAAMMGESLRGTSFTLGERYYDAPSHLRWADDIAGFTVRIDDGSISVSEGVPAEPDLLIQGDYNAVLPLASTVFGRDAESGNVRLRAQREYGHLAQRNPMSLSGRLPEEPVLVRLLGDLHDHLARRTINNPDIDHRIKHLGLTSNVAELDDSGWTVLEGAFTADLAAELRNEINRNHDAQPDDAGFRATMLLARGRLWEEAAVHPWVLTLAEHMLGRGCLMAQSDSIRKTAGLDTHPGLHADYSAWMVAEPFPAMCLEATAVWAIDDFVPEAGPTVLLPGSFRHGRMVPPGTSRDGTVQIEMAKGSIAFWHGATWHGAAQRTAPGTRVSLHNSYVRTFVRPIERYDNLDQAIIDRNSPAFSALCGLDDCFGKSGPSGADFERIKYCRDAGYGQRSFAARGPEAPATTVG